MRNGAGSAVHLRHQDLMRLRRPDLAWIGIRERKETGRRGGVGVGTWMWRERERATHGGRENDE